MSGSVAYVSQVPWVRAGSVKENILFGDTMDREMYDGVIDACALGPDLDCLPHHDETQLGEQGINLSGNRTCGLDLHSYGWGWFYSHLLLAFHSL